jgi:type I restriction enzyme, S subunit
VTRVGLGKVAIAPEPLCFSQDSQALVFNSDLVESLYLTYHLKSAVQVFKHWGRGTTISGVTKRQLLELTVMLPPLAEQQRIVAEIEKQFTRLDAAVRVLERAKANLRRYRAAVLKAACEGRLVPTEADVARAEGRGYEPADALLERILRERRAKWEADQLAKMEAAGKRPKDDSWKTKYVEPSPPKTDGLPSLPGGWTWVTVDQLTVESLANGRSTRDAMNGFPVLRLTALKDGEIDLSERKIGAWTESEARPYLVKEGDFFVSRGNGSLRLVGRGGLVVGEPDAVAYPDTLIRVRVSSEGADPRYLRQIWDSSVIRAQVEAAARTTAGIYKINQRHIGGFILPLPPIEEQRRIAAEVERLSSVIKVSEALIDRSLKRAERLRQAVLKLAFEGRLVEQDPTDEPASVLLEHIRSERAAAGSVGAAQRRSRRSSLAAGASSAQRRLDEAIQL